MSRTEKKVEAVAALRKVIEKAWEKPKEPQPLGLGLALAVEAGGYLMATTVYVWAGETDIAWRVFGEAIRRYPAAVFTRTFASALLALCLGPERYNRFRNRGRGAG